MLRIYSCGSISTSGSSSSSSSTSVQSSSSSYCLQPKDFLPKREHLIKSLRHSRSGIDKFEHRPNSILNRKPSFQVEQTSNSLSNNVKKFDPRSVQKLVLEWCQNHTKNYPVNLKKKFSINFSINGNFFFFFLRMLESQIFHRVGRMEWHFVRSYTASCRIRLITVNWVVSRGGITFSWPLKLHSNF